VGGRRRSAHAFGLPARLELALCVGKRHWPSALALGSLRQHGHVAFDGRRPGAARERGCAVDKRSHCETSPQRRRELES